MSAVSQLLTDIKNVELAGYHSPYYYEIFSAYLSKYLSPHLNESQQQLALSIIQSIVTDQDLQRLLEFPSELDIKLEVIEWNIIPYLLDFICRSILGKTTMTGDDDYQTIFTEYLFKLVLKDPSPKVQTQVKEIMSQISVNLDIRRLTNLPMELGIESFEFTLEWQLILHLIEFSYDVLLLSG